MKLELLVIGKVKHDFILKGILDYEKRINHFVKFKISRLPSVKVSSNRTEELVQKEADKFLSCMTNADNVILLDVKGKKMDTPLFSNFLEKNVNQHPGKSIFLIGGAYGVSESIIKRANKIVALSDFTFTHDMSQLILLEQIYRGYTILKNVPYHH